MENCVSFAVFDVVVDDEVEFFVGEAVVLGEDFVYLIENTFSCLRSKLFHLNFTRLTMIHHSK